MTSCTGSLIAGPAERKGDCAPLRSLVWQQLSRMRANIAVGATLCGQSSSTVMRRKVPFGFVMYTSQSVPNWNGRKTRCKLEWNLIKKNLDETFLFGALGQDLDMGVVLHDDVFKWKHFPHYWPFVRGIHRSPVNSPHKGQWRRVLMFSLICAWTDSCANYRDAGV